MLFCSEFYVLIMYCGYYIKFEASILDAININLSNEFWTICLPIIFTF